MARLFGIKDIEMKRQSTNQTEAWNILIDLGIAVPVDSPE